MSRQIRHNVEGGGYPITTRGMGRREIFSADRDREHFAGLSIPELAAFAGIEPAAASKALQRMKERLPGDRRLKSIFGRSRLKLA